MTIGRFLAGVAAVIYSTSRSRYLLLRRSPHKDFGAGAWECVTGRVDQGEGFEEAMYREVREELGIEIKVDAILGVTHFYRGSPLPENELVGVICLCSLENEIEINLSSEHSESLWATFNEARILLSSNDPSTGWFLRVLQRAEQIRTLSPTELRLLIHKQGIEFG
jgi:8-oxo-dGTP pyrophosphatase MutT (NUDIX family)